MSITPAPVTADVDLLDQAQDAYARAAFATAAELAAQVLALPQLQAPQRMAASMVRLGALYRQGALEEVIQDLAHALDEIRPDTHRLERLELLRMGSLACGETGRYQDALRHAHEAMALAGDDPTQRVYALNAQASCFERMGDPWQAARLMDAALALIDAADGGAADAEAARQKPYARLLTLNNLCATLLGMFHILRDAGAPEDAQRVLERAQACALEALPLARARGDAWPAVFIEGNLAEVQVHLGRPEQALDTLDSALARARANGFTAQGWALRCTWAEASTALGRAAPAQTELEAVMQEIGTQRPVAVLLRLHHALHRAHAAQGSVAQALHHLEQFLALERQRTARQLQAQSSVLVTRLEMEQARQLAEQANREASRHRRRADAWADAAVHDPLTGLLNRRGLEERLRVLVAPRGLLCVVMVDVDHFKRVNDAHGHAVGDAVLERMARLMRNQLRPEDVLSRFGGEEFTLLLAGLEQAQATEVCERLRTCIEREDWQAVGLGAGEVLTVSVGLSMVPAWPADGRVPDLAELTRPADEALYRAKRLGRNRVEMG